MGANLLKELIINIRAFAQKRDWDQFRSPKNLAMALSVEVAEVVEHFQWLTAEESDSLPADKIKRVKEEIGDIMIYLTRLADRLGIDPVQAAEDKMRINERKYPVEKAKGNAVKYTDFE
jgi:NTP pyrophosphatase (non-canonical NTP hydrolase)